MLTHTRRPLRACCVLRAACNACARLLVRSSESYRIRLPNSPPSCLHRPHKVLTQPFPACAAPAPPLLRIFASTAAPSAPPPLRDHLLPRQLPTTPKQRAHHAARLPASCPQRGLLAQSQDAPARFSAASRTDALLQSRRFERYGPGRRRVLARPRCTAGARLLLRTWPGGLVA